MDLTGIPEIDEYMMLELPVKDILSLCETGSRYIDSLCRDDSFWRQKLYYDFSKDFISYLPTNLPTWKEKYIWLYRHMDDYEFTTDTIDDKDIQLLYKMDIKSFIELVSINRHFNQLTKEDLVWKARVYNEFDTKGILAKPDNLSWRDYYVTLIKK